MTAASSFYTAAHSEMKLFILNLFAARIINFSALAGFPFVFLFSAVFSVNVEKKLYFLCSNFVVYVKVWHTRHDGRLFIVV